MSAPARVLAGLGLGILVGALAAHGDPEIAGRLIAIVSPVGGLFVNLIRMTAVPLVASMLVASLGTMASADGLGALAGRAFALATAIVVFAVVLSAMVALPVFAALGIDAAAVGPAQAPMVNPTSPSLAQWLTDLVPQNAFKAAADGAVLPVIVVAVLFGVALARVPDAQREPVVLVAQGVAATMQRVVAWVLWLAPVGVCALAVPLAARMGAAAGGVLTYVGLVVALTTIGMLFVLYPLGVLGGRLPLREFIAYCAPGQAIGFASRSSLAALPAMIASAERRGLGPAVSRLVLPLLASLSHFGAAIQQTVGVIFLAALSGVSWPPGVMASLLLAVVVATYAVPSIPGGSIIAIVPVLSVAGVPAEGIGILLAVDTIPDMFRTSANLTGALTLAAVLDRRRPRPAP